MRPARSSPAGGHDGDRANDAKGEGPRSDAGSQTGLEAVRTPAGYVMLGKLALRRADQAFGMPQRAVTFRV